MGIQSSSCKLQCSAPWTGRMRTVWSNKMREGAAPLCQFVVCLCSSNGQRRQTQTRTKCTNITNNPSTIHHPPSTQRKEERTRQSVNKHAYIQQKKIKRASCLHCFHSPLSLCLSFSESISRLLATQNERKQTSTKGKQSNIGWDNQINLSPTMGR